MLFLGFVLFKGFYNAFEARGWFRNYNSTHEVECPAGAPAKKTALSATVACGSRNLAKSSAIVLYKGKPVKMVVVGCG